MKSDKRESHIFQNSEILTDSYNETKNEIIIKKSEDSFIIVKDIIQFLI